MNFTNVQVLDKPKKMGVRAQAKRASQEKIISAARRLFSQFGFEATTLRHIADAAGLGITTLFNHINDKRDLIYLIFNDQVEEVTYRAIAAPRPKHDFREKILAISEPYFRLFATEPVLARILLSEVLQEVPGPHLERHWALRKVLMDELVKLAATAQKSGELKLTLSPEVIGHSIFFAFNGSSRWWITSATPDWRSGQRQFRDMLSMMLDGVREERIEVSR